MLIGFVIKAMPNMPFKSTGIAAYTGCCAYKTNVKTIAGSEISIFKIAHLFNAIIQFIVLAIT